MCNTFLSGHTAHPILLKHELNTCLKLKELKGYVLRPKANHQWMTEQLPQSIS